MAKIRGGVIEDTEVVIDGNEYTGTQFQRAHVVFGATKPVSLVGCTFNECSFGFAGPAAITLQFMTALYQSGPGGRDLIEMTLENIRNGGYPDEPPKQESDDAQRS